MYRDMHRDGLEIVNVMLDDMAEGVATARFAQQWKDQYNLDYDVVADTGNPEATLSYFMEGSLPLNMVVHGETMQILFKFEGYEENYLRSMLQASLDMVND